MAPGILAVWNDSDPEHAARYEDWYMGEHLPERLAVPGFQSARRFEAVLGEPRFFTFYETDGAQVLASPAYLERLAAPTPATRRIMAGGGFRNMRRAVMGVVLDEGSGALGGHALSLRLDGDQAPDAATLDGLAAAGRAVAALPGVVRVRVWSAHPDPARAGTAESSLRPAPDGAVGAALVVETLRAAEAYAIADAEAVGGLADGGARLGVYRLLCHMSAP